MYTIRPPIPTDILLLAVLWRVHSKLSLRNVAEMFLERGFGCTHEAIRDWETRFAPLIAEQLPTKRRRVMCSGLSMLMAISLILG
jgi:transposase-like protein